MLGYPHPPVGGIGKVVTPVARFLVGGVPGISLANVGGLGLALLMLVASYW